MTRLTPPADLGKVNERTKQNCFLTAVTDDYAFPVGAIFWKIRNSMIDKLISMIYDLIVPQKPIDASASESLG